ncbi:MAG: Ribosomal protein, partial [Chloroflexota bacterium]|nr:Ribosomal protein [Chloroflexota bacterium]
MSRSVKKGPVVEARLLGRIEEMNKRNEKKVVKSWS